MVFVVIAALAVGGVWVVAESEPESSRVVVGSVDDFPVGSVTRLDVEAKVSGPVPRIHEGSGAAVVDVPVFVINDATEGLSALYVSDPHLGCRIMLASELPPETGWEPGSAVVFLNPCHGEMYDYLGRYLAGPAPRGMDRFAVELVDGQVIVDVAAFEYGPDR